MIAERAIKCTSIFLNARIARMLSTASFTSSQVSILLWSFVELLQLTLTLFMIKLWIHHSSLIILMGGRRGVFSGKVALSFGLRGSFSTAFLSSSASSPPIRLEPKTLKFFGVLIDSTNDYNYLGQCSRASSSMLRCLPKWRLLEGESCSSLQEYVDLGSADASCATGPSTKADARSLAGNYITKQEWLEASGELASSLGIDPVGASEAEHRRVFQLYLPVFFWIKALLVKSSGDGAANMGVDQNRSALVIGVNAPQGCGKSTLVEEMKRMLDKAGHACVVLSIDDFYLSRSEQETLASRHPGNPLLQVRGNAGTHDLALGLQTIRALRGAKTEIGRRSPAILVPRYDKSAKGGKGDRAPIEDWAEVTTPPDVIVLEGWMLGFEALPEDSPVLAEADKGESPEVGLREVNGFLRSYGELHGEMDAWVVLKTADPAVVFEWRAEAERKMRESGRPGMSEDEVRDFCARYMPAYRAYLPGLYASMEMRRGESCASGVSLRGDELSRGAGQVLVIEVGRDRNPVQVSRR